MIFNKKYQMTFDKIKNQTKAHNLNRVILLKRSTARVCPIKIVMDGVLVLENNISF